MTENINHNVEDISRQLCSFLSENILADDISVNAETELTTLGVDSFSLMEMVLFIERAFGLVLTAESLTPENIASVNSLSHHCATLLK